MNAIGTSGPVDVLYLSSTGTGWGPVDELARLVSRLLGAKLTTVIDRGEVSTIRKCLALLPRLRSNRGTLIVIASSPAQLAYAANLRHWIPGYERTAAWVIDSFWTDRVSRFARYRGHLDDIFVTDRELVQEWGELTGSRTHWLPWGSDTLAFERDFRKDRPVDLLRLGRQPPAWDNDDVLRSDAVQRGLVAAGRPPFAATTKDNQRNVRIALSGAKFVLAFHNLVSPAPYTHPFRSYLTGRWMDALSAGATVAGSAPDAARFTLWEGATVEIDAFDRVSGLRTLQAHVRQWTPEQAVRQQELARRRLDWRHRIIELVDLLGLMPSDQIRIELEALK